MLDRRGGQSQASLELEGLGGTLTLTWHLNRYLIAVTTGGRSSRDSTVRITDSTIRITDSTIGITDSTIRIDHLVTDEYAHVHPRALQL